MKYLLVLLQLISISIILSSCATTKVQPVIQNKVITEKSIVAIETTEGNEVAYIHYGTENEIFCSSSGNDFAFNESSGISMSAKAATDSIGIGSNTSSGIAELGGINSGVLITREIFYRTCEFMGNLKAIGGLTPEVAQEVFKTSLDAILKVSSDYVSSPETGQGNETITSTSPTVE
jgi:hypothetical protein